MANAKFAYFNYIVQPETEISVYSGGENPFYPVSNLKHPHALKVFRSSAAATAVLVFDFQTAVTINSFLAKGSSIGALDLTAVTIEANATDVWTSPAFSTTVTDFDYYTDLASKFFTAQTYRYWRVTVSGTAWYVEVGKLFLGTSVTLDNNNVAMGLKFGDEDLSEVDIGRYGQRYIDVITDLATVKGSFGLLNPTELDTIKGLYDYCGRSKPFWAVLDPDGLTVNNKDILSGYFYFMQKPTFTQDFFNLWSSEFELVEAK